MSIGQPVSMDGLNSQLSNGAVSLRNSTALAEQLWGWIETLGPDQTTQEAALVTMGFSSQDASDFWVQANHLWAIYQIYHGMITQPSTFDYHDAMAVVRGAQ